MKKSVCLVMALGWGLVGFSQEPGFRLAGQGSATIPVTANKMTNLIFPSAVRVGVKVSAEVLVQKVRGVENVIELKAMHKGFQPTNLSVYGLDGRLYSFVLRYVEDTAVLNYRVVTDDGSPIGPSGSPVAGSPIVLAGQPVNSNRLADDASGLGRRRPFLRIATQASGVRLRLDGIWLQDSLQWFCFTLRNRSVVVFTPVRWRFYLADIARVKRRAEQEVELQSVYGSVAPLAGHFVERLAIGFMAFTVPAGKRLVVEVVGQDGRQLVLRVKGREVLKVRSVK